MLRQELNASTEIPGWNFMTVRHGDELMSGTVSEMARRELCWAFYSITLLATCCTAIRRAEEFDDPKPPVEVSLPIGRVPPC